MDCAAAAGQTTTIAAIHDSAITFAASTLPTDESTEAARRRAVGSRVAPGVNPHEVTQDQRISQVSNTYTPPAPSVVARVGPLPGEIPGLPVDFRYRPIRQLVPTPPQLAVTSEPDNWRRLFDGDSAGDFDGPGEQYGRAG